MLGMVCHREYIAHGENQTVCLSIFKLIMIQAFVVHFEGFRTGIYFATFPSEYLNAVRNENLDSLKDRTSKIELNHTQLYNLYEPVDRTQFIKDMVAMFRFVAAGEANIGYLRKNGDEIHRKLDSAGNPVSNLESGALPPQRVMDEQEEEDWLKNPDEEYAT
jgi:hypothetical protein